ncbi:hypothetical protein HPB52_000956 [Rhipicephalus sanguineus]|uniref:Peptidase aspartic putative domain-containing protein n=1 Tax=Rhipicephalus sanguineus TaxID=34632 RepID=A0A9D4PH28_RHISA|nr:hypothetical protein HPB52_000956 [Rhipicephalus sanguineus]
MLSFLRIQIEVREQGRPGQTPSAFSRLLPEEDVEPPSAPMRHLPTASALPPNLLQLRKRCAPYAAVVSTPTRTATFNSQLSKTGSVAHCSLLLPLRLAKPHGAFLPTPNPCKRNDSEPRRASHRRARHEHAVSDIGPKRPERNQRRSSPSRTSLDRVRVPKRLVRILVDSGSRRTFIRAHVSKDLRCPVIETKELSLVMFSHSKPREVMRSRRVALAIRGQGRDTEVTVEDLEVPEVCAVTSPPISSAVLSRLCEKNYDVADNLDPDTWHPQEISVLLGSDVYWKVATGRIDRLSSDLTALETKFGWTVQGAMELAGSSTPTSILFLNCSTTSLTHFGPSTMRRLDVIRVKPSTQDNGKALSQLDILKESTVNLYGRNQVPSERQVPGIPSGSNSRRLAERYLQSQFRRFQEQPKLLKQYDAVVKADFKEEQAKRVEAPQTQENAYDTPHRAVLRQDAIATELRALFDASLRMLVHPYQNYLLLNGIKLNAEIVQLLLVFQYEPVVKWKFVGDRIPWWGGWSSRVIRSAHQSQCRSPRQEFKWSSTADILFFLNAAPINCNHRHDRTSCSEDAPIVDDAPCSDDEGSAIAQKTNAAIVRVKDSRFDIIPHEPTGRL